MSSVVRTPASSSLANGRLVAARRAKVAGDAAAAACYPSDAHARADTHAYDAAYAAAIPHWLRAARLIDAEGQATDEGGDSALERMLAKATALPTAALSAVLNQQTPPITRADLDAGLRLAAQTFTSMPDAARADIFSVPPSVPGPASTSVSASVPAGATSSSTSSTRSIDSSGSRPAAAGSGLTSLQFLGAAWPCIEVRALETLVASMIEMVGSRYGGPCYEGRRNRVAQAFSLALDLLLE